MVYPIYGLKPFEFNITVSHSVNDYGGMDLIKLTVSTYKL